MPRKKQSRKKPNSAAQASAHLEQPERRIAMRAMMGAAGAFGLGGAGWFAVQAVQATAAEMDLSRVGQGKPSIVQIHDPTCPMCTQLQRETRAALSCFEECEIVYLVANINGDEGRQFALQYGVPHVTLLLFDAEGTHVNTLRGVRDSEELKSAFEALRKTA